MRIAGQSQELTTTTQDAERLLGSKYVKHLEKHLRRLRQAYPHGNRQLFYDDLVTVYLLAFFNPTVRSLRTLDDLSQLPDTQELLHIRRLCRSTLSDANALMDARLLEPIIARLRQALPDLEQRDGQLARLLKQVKLVDGSFFAAAADVVWALHKRKGNIKPGKSRRGSSEKYSKVRMDLHLSGWDLLPCHIAVQGKGTSEPDSAAQHIAPHSIYVADRAYIDFKYVSDLLDAPADFVLRFKEKTVNFDIRQDLPLDEDDGVAGVISDHLGRLSGSPHTRRSVPKNQELRLVVVYDPQHPDKPIYLLTSLLDVPAHIIAALYLWRWQIELFFRWLKVHANFRHLISHSKNGMTLGFYVSVIAVLLMYLHTGRPMSKYAYNLLALVAGGWGSLENILPILERREKECERERERQAAKRAAKNKV